jgi:transcriptional regulator with XRE-family HTH domain
MFLLAVPACSRHYGGVTDVNRLRLVGRAVAARRGQLGMTQQDLADAANVDLKTVYNLESGTRWPIAKNRVAISAALRWEDDALAAILAGEAPAVPADPAPPRPRHIPVLDDADPEEIGPFERAVWAEVLRATEEHGPNPPGALVFPASLQEQQIWDSPFPLTTREEKIRLIALLRLMADQQLHGQGENAGTGLVGT